MNAYEKVFNGNMELDDGWADDGGATEAQSSTFSHSGTYSWKYTGDLLKGIVSDTWTSVANQKYYFSAWVLLTTLGQTDLTVNIRKGDNSAYVTGSGTKTVVKDVWTKVEFEYTEGAGTAGTGAFIRFGSLVPEITVYVDDVSVLQKVTKTPDPFYKETLNEKKFLVKPCQ